MSVWSFNVNIQNEKIMQFLAEWNYVAATPYHLITWENSMKLSAKKN